MYFSNNTMSLVSKAIHGHWIVRSVRACQGSFEIETHRKLSILRCPGGDGSQMLSAEGLGGESGEQLMSQPYWHRGDYRLCECSTVFDSCALFHVDGRTLVKNVQARIRKVVLVHVRAYLDPRSEKWL